MTCGVVAVAAGDGMRRLYQQLGAYVVEGGPTLNPSTFELLAGIHERRRADEVVVLPNSGNVIMAAERAAELSEKDGRGGRLALAAGGPRLPRRARPGRRARGERACACASALDDMATGAVAPAARDDKQGRFAQGDAVGFVGRADRRLGRRRAETLVEVFERLAEGREILTCVCGAGRAARRRPRSRRSRPSGVELELPRRRAAALLVADRRGVSSGEADLVRRLI